MIIIDIVIIGLSVLSSLLGLIRGFVKEFLSLTKWLLSAYITYISFEQIKSFLSAYIRDTIIIEFLASGVVFGIIFLILSIIFNFISRIINTQSLGLIDKILGFSFGFLRIILIFSLIFIIYKNIFFDITEPDWISDSFFIEYIDYTSKYIQKNILDLDLNNDIILES
tara:strand:- start:89 stop:592 length:504 start_codon:yes stop_codon:yes gene_type:complete